MASRILLTALTALTLLQQATAQTFTSCDPLNATCPPDIALGTTNVTFDFTSSAADPAIWNTTAGPMTYGAAGAAFTISERGQSPTIQSNFYIMFGVVSVVMQAAKGTGIISSIVLESDDLDEVDWEFMGGNTTHVETNYFGKGNTTSYDRAIYYPVDSPQENWHNYTTHWTAEKLEWWIDGKLVRTLAYGDANGGRTYPQTPMNLRLGIWAGGDPKEPNGTIIWAGGVSDYKGVPYSMFVRNVTVTDFSTGSEYSYSDHSGSWQSIKAKAGNSTIVAELNAPHGIAGRWNALPKATRSAIVACSVGGFGLLAAALLVFCLLQGRKGAKEKAVADQAWEKEQADFQHYRLQMMKGGFGAEGPPQKI